MATTVAHVLALVGYELNDEELVRWTSDELVSWVSEAQRAVVSLRPDAHAAMTHIDLVAGARQSIPSDGFTFISATSNTDASGVPVSAVRRTDRVLLDLQSPDWYSETPTTEVVTYSSDSAVPTRFWVYPPSDGAGHLEIVYGTMPDDVTSSDSLALLDVYTPAVINYVLYRAYLKDSEFAGNAALASGFYKAFTDAVAGVK